ncbi:hypothetical protein ACQI4F_11730 [Mycolicibacterium vaccae]|uniref:hypothetical protein n=1 Tax=Mycolicibacterium vaccae TaxID=1810 RepID=UPI003CE70916
MTAVAVLIAVSAALVVGYLLGRRAAVRPRYWRQRTSRTALVRQAAGLAALVAVYRLRIRIRESALAVVITRPARRSVHPRRAWRGFPLAPRG